MKSIIRIATLAFLITIEPGCSSIQVGPFVPYNAKVCSSDVQCKDGERCWFPGVNTKAVCMPGANEAVAPYPPLE